MQTQRGFTLIEMMVVIGIIAILSAVAIPTYQNYLRKAALTDMLQTATAFRTAVELCAIDNGGLTDCEAGKQGIPAAKPGGYTASIGIKQGVITLAGQKSLTGLSIVLTPQWNDGDGLTGWSRQCNATSNSDLQHACEAVFRQPATTAGVPG